MFPFVLTVAKRLLPTFLYIQLIEKWGHDGFKKYLTNTGWLFSARIISYVISFFTIAFVARYLGPENYGKLSYAQSFVTLFSIFASLGIDNILYRNLISHPEKEHELLGTAIFSKLFFGSIAFFAAVIAAFFLNSDPILTTLICIVSLTLIFQPFAALNHFFGAKVKSKYYAYITVFLAFFIAGLKIIFVYLQVGIIYFATLILLEALLYTILYLLIYLTRFKGKLAKWRFSPALFKELLRDSWPLLLAGFSVSIYGRIDQIMIQHFLDSRAVGLYDAAVRLTEIWIFFPSLIIGSLFPAITNAYTQDLKSYTQRMRALIFLTLGLMMCIIIPIFLLAPYIVRIIFGAEFIETATILRIYIWSGIGITVVALVQSHLIIENKGVQFFLITLTGAIANIFLNALFIPQMGIPGAAVATLISYAIMLTTLFLFSENRKTFSRIFFQKTP